MFVCCECCVLSGRGLCDELITHPEKSYQLWCVVVCDLETLWMRRPWPTEGCCAKNKQTNMYVSSHSIALSFNIQLLFSNNSYSCIFHSNKYLWFQLQMCAETWTYLYIKWLLKSPLDLNQNWRGSTRFHNIFSAVFKLFHGDKQGEAAIQTGDLTGLQVSKQISGAGREKRKLMKFLL